MIIKTKKDCTVIIQDFKELGLNSNPFLKGVSPVAQTSIDSEVHSLMIAHGMTQEEAEKTHKENMSWAM